MLVLNIHNLLVPSGPPMRLPNSFFAFTKKTDYDWHSYVDLAIFVRNDS